jgi:cell division transport system permease protein
VISFVVFSLRRAWQGFWRNAIMSLAATGTMVLMLLLLSGFWIIRTGLVAALEFTGSKVNVIADLPADVTDEQARQLELEIEGMPEVTSVDYVTRDEALRRFRESRAAQGEEDLTRFLESNPLQASLEIYLSDPSQYTVVRDRLSDEPRIDQPLKDQQSLVVGVNTVITILGSAGTVILIGVGLIALFIIVNTIRLAVFARQEEIEVMRLVGASDAFIRWPFVFEGALVGLLGAAITLLVLFAAAEPLGQFMVSFFEVLPIRVAPLARDVTLLVVGTGVGLGIVGAWVSVRTYLIR